MAVMTSNELVSKLHDIVNNYKTVYAYGVFGAPLTESILTSKQKQYSWFYTAAKMSELRSKMGVFGFDCVNLVKALLWGWNGDKSQVWGGAKYASNGVPDTNADGMINYCKGVSTNFGNIEVGEALWIPGHFGVYIGDGKAIECTPAWKNNVQITAVGNIGTISGLPTRSWNKHGKLPWVSYNSVVPTIATTQNNPIGVGDTVSISGGVYGGLSSTRGKAIPGWVTQNNYTVTRIANHKGVDEALLSGINSWVSFEYLQKL